MSDHNFLSRHIGLPKSIPHIYLDSSADDNLSAGLGREQSSSLHSRPHPPSYHLAAVATVSASVVLASRFSTSSTCVLGISSVIFTAIGLVLFGSALQSSKDDAQSSTGGFMSANGTFSRRFSGGTPKNQHKLAALRDVAAAVAIACGVATYFMEPGLAPDTISWESVYRELPGDWKTLHHYRAVREILWMTCVQLVINLLTSVLLSQQGVVHTSFLFPFACICARLHMSITFSGVWFTVIYGSSALPFLSSNSPSSFIDIRNSIRLRRILMGVTVLSIGLLYFRRMSVAHEHYRKPYNSLRLFASPPENPFEPVRMNLAEGHPAAQLIAAAEDEHESLLNRQSRTLGEAVQEYRRRNGIAPPPRFDKWYEFATRNGVVMIDEFDSITQALLPYWAVDPLTIRTRITNALGFEDSALLGMMIRDGSVVKVEGGEEWQQQATTGMMKDFVQYLPDMDLGFNIHDEPRVIVPNDHLSAMVAKARDEVLPIAMKKEMPRNSFSPRPSDMSDGKRFEETSVSRFNRFAHQQTWTHARLSCPADSQAQKFEDQVPDNLTSYAVTDLKYIYNVSAFSDICNSPSLSSNFGFFERPNAFSIIHELTPIFSQSKISSFQDLLYPSPWYWFGKVGYDENRDTSWENKTNSLYWRGSTTGGFSRNGGWRRQHRQRVVRRLNAPDKASIFVPQDSSPNAAYSIQEVDRRLYKHLIDVKFSHIGQCDPGDCDAQKEFFEVTDRVDGQDAWYYKHLLDMDGNAFSGRYYSFLRSQSLVYKMSIFREWHQEWLKPWVHYVPLTLIGDEHLDLVRWFSGGKDSDESKTKIAPGSESEDNRKTGNGDSLGECKAREIAARSREWADKVLRNVDFEVWFFRLLLEYGRVVDDDRENIGYPGP